MSRHNKRRSKLRKRMTVFGGGTVAVAAVVATVNVASAGQVSTTPSVASKADHAVFVQGNELAGNTIHVFRRGDDGKLTAAGKYATGGKGGDQVDAPTDSLASQGSLVYDDRSGRLLAVNAGSGTLTSFAVQGQKLMDRQTVPTGVTSPPPSPSRAISPTS